MNPDRFKQAPCRKCGKSDYIMCRIGDKHVCVDCFQKRCKQMESKRPPPPVRYRLNAGGRPSAQA